MTALWDALLAWVADRILDAAERFGPALFAWFTTDAA